MTAIAHPLSLLSLALLLFLSSAVAADLVLVSVDSNGNQSNGISLGEVSISADGRFVVFQTGGIYVAADTTNVDIYLRDRDTDEDGVYDEPGAVATLPLSVSVDQIFANFHSYRPSISDNGRFVSFDSRATNLTDENVSGSYAQVFLLDRDVNGNGVFYEVDMFDKPNDIELVLASHRVSPSTWGGDRGSERSFAANNGRLAFSSTATNLVVDDRNDRIGDVFFYDLDPDGDWVFWEADPLPVLTRVSDAETPLWTGQPWGISGFSSISRDGRFVAYESDAEDLLGPKEVYCSAEEQVINEETVWVPVGVCVKDIFVLDRDNDGDGINYDLDDDHGPVTVQITLSPSGEPANGESRMPNISPDGRFVTFTSAAGNLVPGDPAGLHCYVHDRDTDADGYFDEEGATSSVLVSVSSSGELANDSCSYPSISANGRFVAFHSRGTNLVEEDTNGYTDTFVHDRDADRDGIFDEDEPGAIATERISVRPDGSPTVDRSEGRTDFSSDGRWIAFVSGDQLLPEDTTGLEDVYVADNPFFYDPDGDGVEDEEEMGPDPANPDPEYDGNGDDIYDHEQDNVASLHSHDGDEADYVTVAAPPETSLVGVEARETPPEKPTEVDLPLGVFGFTVDGVEPGGEVIVDLYLPEGTQLNGYWKYGRTHELSDPHWYEFVKEPGDIVGADLSEVSTLNVVHLHFVDGENGDDDLAVNGVIIDPGAPALVPEPGAALLSGAALACLAALAASRKRKGRRC